MQLIVLDCRHVTTIMSAIKTIDLDLLGVSPLRPQGSPLPVPKPHDIELAERAGFSALPLIKARYNDLGSYEILSGITTWRIAFNFLGIMSLDVEIVDVDDDTAQWLVNQDFQWGVQGEAAVQIDPADLLAQGEFIERWSRRKGQSYKKIGESLDLDRRMASLAVRLASLAPEVKQQVRQGELTIGLAKMLVTLPYSQQRQLAKQAINESWTARHMETMVRAQKKGAAQPSKQHPTRSKKTTSISIPGSGLSRIDREERKLSDLIGNPVEVYHAEGGGGAIVIKYHNTEEYEGIADRLRHTPVKEPPAFPDDDWDESDFQV